MAVMQPQREPMFRERTYHDRLLSFGSPAPRALAFLLFGDPAR